MSFPQGSVGTNQSATSTPDPSGAASAALKLGQTQNLFGALPGGNLGSAFGPGSAFANTYQLSPAANFFNTGIQGMSLPGGLLNQAQGYTGPGGALGSLFQMNPQSQQIYQQGVQDYSSLLNPGAGGPFQNWLNQTVGPMATNNAIASGYGGASGATLQALTNAASQAAMQYGSMIPGLTSSGLNFAQTPQNMQIQGLTSMGLPLALQDYQNLQTGLQAGQLPTTMAQGYGLNMQAQLNALLAGLPFPVGTTQAGTGQQQNSGSILGSILAPAAATGLGLGGAVSLQNLLSQGQGGGQGGSSLASLGSQINSLGSNFGSSIGSLLGNLSAGGSAAPEGSGLDALLALGQNGGLSFL